MMTPLSPDYQARCNNAAVAVLDDRGIGFENRNGVFHVSDLPAAQAIIDDTAAQLATAQRIKLAELADYRWQREVAGTTVSGMPIATDRDSQGKLTSIRVASDADPNYTVRLKTAAGFVTLGRAAIVAVTDAARAYVQACYDREADLAATIAGMTAPAMALALDISQGWPA